MKNLLTVYRKVFGLTLILTGFAVLPPLAAQKPAGSENDRISRRWMDLPYAATSGAQRLDLYLPAEGKGPFPVILSIHGGAFLGGDKGDRQVIPMLEGLERGYAVVSINYRLSGEAIWPAQIHDCKAAVRWVRANAKQYRLDPDKIATWGGSAGGHLSAMVGTSGDVGSLEDLTLGIQTSRAGSRQWSTGLARRIF
jgi:acetyl esterase/lipase